MRIKHIIYAGFMMAALSSCGNNAEEGVATSSFDNATAPMPDVGKVDVVSTKAEGFGSSPAIATTEAMKNAILQVNGADIDMASVSVKYGLDITDGKDMASIRANSFADMVAHRSGGAIRNFKIVDVAEPKPWQKDGFYRVTIEADIAHFTAPADSRKIKVVVAPVKIQGSTVVIGTKSYPSGKIAADIQQRVTDALSNTGRFSVLDRQISSEIEAELDMIRSGSAPRAETGKLGQAFTADVLWIGTVNNLAYTRHARQLRTSNRELVSYSGGWGLSQKLVNVATRQIMISAAMEGRAPSVAPTTLGTGVDADKILQDMINNMSNEIVSSILAKTFPVTVVSRDGETVVLSQGGKSVKDGARYALMAMGKEIKDPKTGESLGRIEKQCAEVVIDQVKDKLSYGHLENVTGSLDGVPPGGLQLGKQLMSVSRSVETSTGPAPANASAGKAPKVQTTPVGEKDEMAIDMNDDKW